MTWTWTRAGPREWRVERVTAAAQLQRDIDRFKAEAERSIGVTPAMLEQRKVTPEEMAEFYARHHRYHGPRPMTLQEYTEWLARLRERQSCIHETRRELAAIFRVGLF